MHMHVHICIIQLTINLHGPHYYLFFRNFYIHNIIYYCCSFIGVSRCRMSVLRIIRKFDHPERVYPALIRITELLLYLFLTSFRTKISFLGYSFAEALIYACVIMLTYLKLYFTYSVAMLSGTLCFCSFELI